MSGGEDGFLSRWSRLKREQARPDREDAREPGPEAGEGDPRQTGQQAGQGTGQAAGQGADRPAGIPAPEPGRSLEDLIESLPKVEDLVPGQDISAFMQAWVPSDLRHAALRRMWLVDPAIRDYVSPALDYAYDYNNPSSIAGFGTMETSAEQIREVMAMFDRAVGKGQAEGEGADSTKVVDAMPQADAAEVAAGPGDVALRDDAAPEAAEAAGQDRDTSEGPPAEAAPGPAGAHRSRVRDAAAQEKRDAAANTSTSRRRHGGALPG